MTRTVQALLLLITLFSCFTANAGTLKGKITDEHGEPLPFATVYIKGTSIGTAANANAEYVLQLSNGTHNIICQYMGFAQVKISVSIKDGETVTRNFSLKEQKLKMDAIVVKADAEDPAYAIIRKAIKKRKYHKKAKTDSGPTEPNSEMPEYIKNIFLLMSLVSTEDVVADYRKAYNECNIRYGDMKKQLAEDMISFIAPIRERAKELQADEDQLRKILKHGAEKARESAAKTVSEARKLIGINYY